MKAGPWHRPQGRQQLERRDRRQRRALSLRKAGRCRRQREGLAQRQQCWRLLRHWIHNDRRRAWLQFHCLPHSCPARLPCPPAWRLHLRCCGSAAPSSSFSSAFSFCACGLHGCLPRCWLHNCPCCCPHLLCSYWIRFYRRFDQYYYWVRFAYFLLLLIQ